MKQKIPKKVQIENEYLTSKDYQFHNRVQFCNGMSFIEIHLIILKFKLITLCH